MIFSIVSLYFVAVIAPDRAYSVLCMVLAFLVSLGCPPVMAGYIIDLARGLLFR